MSTYYRNTAGQRFVLPDQALEPSDSPRRSRSDEDDWYEPVCYVDDERED